MIILESRKHKELAEKLANIKGAEYHGDKGVDIRTPDQAIEVEVDPDAFGQAKQQLAGTTKTPYLAVPTVLKNEALKAVEGTRFGVMGPSGQIYKRGGKK